MRTRSGEVMGRPTVARCAANPQLIIKHSSVVSGFPATTMLYTADAAQGDATQTVTTVVVAATFCAKLSTVAAVNPSDPIYQRDSQDMLNGFQVLAPT